MRSVSISQLYLWCHCAQTLYCVHVAHHKTKLNVPRTHLSHHLFLSLSLSLCLQSAMRSHVHPTLPSERLLLPHFTLPVVFTCVRQCFPSGMLRQLYVNGTSYIAIGGRYILRVARASAICYVIAIFLHNIHYIPGTKAIVSALIAPIIPRTSVGILHLLNFLLKRCAAL